MLDPAAAVIGLLANLGRLSKRLVSNRGVRREELARIRDVFGDPPELAQFYVEPKCQHHNPADRHEDREPIAQVRAPAFEAINDFLRGDFPPLGDGPPSCSSSPTPGWAKPPCS